MLETEVDCENNICGQRTASFLERLRVTLRFSLFEMVEGDVLTTDKPALFHPRAPASSRGRGATTNVLIFCRPLISGGLQMKEEVSRVKAVT